MTSPGPIRLSIDDGQVDAYAGDDDQVVLAFGPLDVDTWLTPDEAEALIERLESALDACADGEERAARRRERRYAAAEQVHDLLSNEVTA